MGKAGGWNGNIGDSNLSAWSPTHTRARERYFDAVPVIPGHGKSGGPELLDYTLDLYQPFAAQSVESTAEMMCGFPAEIGVDNTDPRSPSLEGAESSANVITLYDGAKVIIITADSIDFDFDRKRVDAPSGYLQIYDREEDACQVRTSASFERLIAVQVDDAVGWAVVLKIAAPTQNIPCIN